MSREIATQQTSLSGATLYATLDSGGQRWNGTAFEAVLLADWSTYAVAMTEAAGTGFFAADQPAGIAAGTPLGVTIFKRSGASPAATDPVVGSGSIGAVALPSGGVTLAASQPNYAPLTTLGATAPTGWITGTVFAASAVTAVQAGLATSAQIPADYQQRGVAVTLPSTAPAGYGVSGTVDANIVSIVGSAPAAQNLHDDELATAPAIPTAAQVAAAVWQLATTGNEPTGSFGALVAGLSGGSGGSVTVVGYATNMDPATIVWGASTRSLTDKAGFALSAAGLDAIRGFNGWSFPRAIRALIAVVIGKRSGVPASGTGGTITFTESTTGDYGTLTVDTNGNITAIGMTPVA